MVGFGISPGLLEVAVTVSVWTSLVAPELMPERFTVCGPASSLIERLARALSVGGSLTAFTVTVNVRVTVLLRGCPSSTVTVIVAVAFPLARGGKMNERRVVATLEGNGWVRIRPR